MVLGGRAAAALQFMSARSSAAHRKWPSPEPMQMGADKEKGDGMNIIVRTNKKGKVTGHQAQVRIAGQKSISRTFKTREQAEAFLQAIEPKVRAKQLLDRKARSSRKRLPGLQELLAMKLRDILIEFNASDATHRYNRYGPAMLDLIGESRVCDLKKKWAETYRDRLRIRLTCFGRPHKWSTSRGRSAAYEPRCTR